jgi:DNA (cytosine-5)-methyltransferase 1
MAQQKMFGPMLKQWVSIREALKLEATVIGGGRNPTSDENDKRTYRDITEEPSTKVAAVQIGNAGPFVLDGDKPDWWHRASSVDEPSRTIGAMANASVSGPDRASDTAWLGAGRRRLTWQECAVLQGFPDGYPFSGSTQASIYKQVGNAVCPIMSEVLGRCVMEVMK